MIKTTKMLCEELDGYRDRPNKIARMVRSGALVPVVRGLYETDAGASPWPLAGCIYGPSYISFDSALSYYDLIPEAGRSITSATFRKGRAKSYETPFGVFLYRDVPASAFPFGIATRREGDASFRIATPEKALCDQLYTEAPIANRGELEALLYDHLRLDMEDLAALNIDDIDFLAERYRSRNVRRLARYLRKGWEDA